MKEGDIVRFAKWEDFPMMSSKHWPLAKKDYIGVLVKHDKLMGTTHILYKGEILRVRPVFVEKAGKKDYENEK